MGDGPWQAQLGAAITTAEGLSRHIKLTREEQEGIETAGAVFRWRITPYYAGLMDAHDPACPIRLQAIPSTAELVDDDGNPDPIGEEAGTVAPHLIRLYADRVAWCVSGSCPTLCRFCFRRRIVGESDGDFSQASLGAGLEFIRGTPLIRDVLVTGGDPLMLSDEKLGALLAEVRRIPHVQIIRIGTRMPVTLPQRITPGLCDVLKGFHPLWINTHFNHPKELTEEAVRACAMLADAGIPLGNQSVLLRGVNDDGRVMKDLVQGLVRARVRPYYLFQCHLSRGTAHFRTPVETGMSLVSGLRGSTTGFAVPTFVVDTPHGKVWLSPQNIVGRDDEAVYLSCPDGAVWREANRRGG